MLNYQTLKNLSDEKLIEGFKILYLNGLNLSATADTLAASSNYGIATVLKILSIEELIKAQSILFVWSGISNEAAVNTAFKGNNIEKSVHRMRLSMAALTGKAVESTLSQLSSEKLEEKVMEIISTMNPSDLNFESIASEFMKNIQDKKDFIDVNGLIEELELLNEEKSSWLFKAQTVKEECLYGGFEKNNWIDPQKTTEATFLKAQEECNTVMSLLNRYNDIVEQPKENHRINKSLIKEFCDSMNL